jgi:twitching motility protein PilT
MALSIDALIAKAKEAGASDLHLEGGLPPALRIQGDLRVSGEPIAPATLTSMARELLGEEAWQEFLAVRSHDLSRTLQGVRCRVNVLHSSRGVGLAIRLLSSFQATLSSLNLHPDLKKLVANRHGLVMVCGPTGCGKSSTVAALLQEINLGETRHIITIESPIEHLLTPRAALVRQRQVGRDTPSFEQALVDALREDPDVLMVGEMRDPETMRLTLNAAETGHLVITTLHSASTSEALARVVTAFPAESQPGICAQLADCLAGVVCQRLRYRSDLRMRVPECEILLPSSGVKGTIRGGQFSRLITALEGGGSEGQWTWARYRSWMDARTDWVVPEAAAAVPLASEPPVAELPKPAARPPAPPHQVSRAPRPKPASTRPQTPEPAAPTTDSEGVLVIDEMDEAPEAILEKLGRR